jgi:hypothetical protein
VLLLSKFADALMNHELKLMAMEHCDSYLFDNVIQMNELWRLPKIEQQINNGLQYGLGIGVRMI